MKANDKKRIQGQVVKLNKQLARVVYELKQLHKRSNDSRLVDGAGKFSSSLTGVYRDQMRIKFLLVNNLLAQKALERKIRRLKRLLTVKKPKDKPIWRKSVLETTVPQPFEPDPWPLDPPSVVDEMYEETF